MNALPVPVLAAALLLCQGTARAADAKPVPEPAVQRLVSEDDQVVVEELRVRGQTQSITVKSKIPGVAPYRIVPATGARDPSQPGSTAGQRVWQFTF
ncbi:hypothetical protein ACPOLB_22540 [Rubrivivax sp. RP6-9]|uniref:hypothetical protein n=1 Tax=Rubrivivax sp. RP6-9 TaxID=3415750 RepID=UPI003CC63793